MDVSSCVSLIMHGNFFRSPSPSPYPHGANLYQLSAIPPNIKEVDGSLEYFCHVI